MKKIDLGQAIGIVANVGVIAGLAILIYELRQNTLVTELLAAESTLTSATEQNRLIIENPEIAELLAELPGVEGTADELRLRNMFAARLRRWAHAHYQFSRSALDPELWAGVERDNVGMIQRIAFYRDLWLEQADEYRSEFRQYVESILSMDDSE